MMAPVADFRPFQALRFDTAVAGEAAGLIAPPYDVVPPEERGRYYSRSPYNIANVDFGEGVGRYQRAARYLRDWLARGVLRREASAGLYAYDQEFSLEGRSLRRRAVFGALRLEEWSKGVVLPHEHTGAAAKADRLRLLRATRVHLSPVFALYRPGGIATVEEAALGAPLLEAALPEERHTLRPVAAAAAEAFCRSLAAARLYIADGHHRYETGLAYRDERRAAASAWTGEEPENFILAALVSAADPGLVILPTHRLLRLRERPRLRRLLQTFSLEDAGVLNGSNLERLHRRLAEEGARGPAFGAIGLEPDRLHLLLPRDPEAVFGRLRALPPVLARLDVSVLERLVLPAVGCDERPESIGYTESFRAAAEAVAQGRWDAAFLLNPTPVDQVLAVADAGERMPRKSTYFYPKLATGIVMLPLAEGAVAPAPG